MAFMIWPLVVSPNQYPETKRKVDVNDDDNDDGEDDDNDESTSYKPSPVNAQHA